MHGADRLQCVKPDGGKICVYCQRHSLKCVMTEDERKRSTSKAYLDSLRSRITLLESMLHQHGLEPPPMEPVESVNTSKNKKSKTVTTARSSSVQSQPVVLKIEPLAPEDYREMSLLSTEECISDWSILSRDIGASPQSQAHSSVPSLSSEDIGTADTDESIHFGPEASMMLNGASISGSEVFGSVGGETGKLEDWSTSLEGGEAWEGQAALLDMGFMLGISTEELDRGKDGGMEADCPFILCEGE
jgi:hypothetical protein